MQCLWNNFPHARLSQMIGKTNNIKVNKMAETEH